MKKTIIKRDAVDTKAGMTFHEIETFVRAAHLIEDAAFVNNPVKIRSTWRGTIRSMQITIEHNED